MGCSECSIPYGSIICPLLFLAYISDLPIGSSSNSRLSADDTSLFSVVSEKNTLGNGLNNVLLKIRNWAY